MTQSQATRVGAGHGDGRFRRLLRTPVRSMAQMPAQMPAQTPVRTPIRKLASALFLLLIVGLLPLPGQMSGQTPGQTPGQGLRLMAGVGLAHADEPTFGAPPQDPETAAMVRQWNGACITCHTEQALLFPPRAGMNLEALANALVDPFAFQTSQHAGMACKTCHGKGYGDYPHADDAQSSIMGCAECHAREAFRVQAQFDQSVHARNLSEQFSCASCHDPHQDRVAADLDDAGLVVAQDNGKCLSCHNSDERFAELGVTLAETRTRPDIDEIHKWLPNTERHWQAVRCVECHTPPSTHSTLAVSHQILDADAAERDCSVCHSQDSALNLRLYRHLVQQETSELGFLNSAILGDNYVIGATRNVYLDRAAYWLVGLLIAALALHGGLRILGSLLRRGKHR